MSRLIFLQSLLENSLIENEQLSAPNVQSSWSIENLPDIKRAAELIDKHCSNMKKLVDDEVYFYRGDSRLPDNPVIIDTAGAKRSSKDSNNIYHVMIDHVLSLRGLPKRSESLIFTTRMGSAGSYGNTFYTFPYNGSVVANVDETDIFRSKFRVGIFQHYSISEIDNILFNYVLPAFGYTGGKVKSLEQLDKLFSATDPTVLALMIFWGHVQAR